MSNLYNKPTLPQQRPSTIQQTDADPTTLNIPTMVQNDTTYGTYRVYADGSTQGRVIQASVLRSAAIALTTNVPKTITSISIPAMSKWRIVAMTGVATDAATVPTRVYLSVSKTNNTLSASDTQNVPTNGEVLIIQNSVAIAGGETDVQTELVYENTTNFSVTLYMVERCNFTAGGAAGYGSIVAESIT